MTLAGGFDWLDKDMSGELTLGDGDLVEFALALDPTDEDPEKTARGMLFAMAQGTKEERAMATEINKIHWLEFWDGEYLTEFDEDKRHAAQKNMDMTMELLARKP